MISEAMRSWPCLPAEDRPGSGIVFQFSRKIRPYHSHQYSSVAQWRLNNRLVHDTHSYSSVFDSFNTALPKDQPGKVEFSGARSYNISPHQLSAGVEGRGPEIAPRSYGREMEAWRASILRTIEAIASPTRYSSLVPT